MSDKLSAENNVHNETELIKQAVFNAKDQNCSIVKDIIKATSRFLSWRFVKYDCEFFYIALISNH